jgi:hypothetical protein
MEEKLIKQLPKGFAPESVICLNPLGNCIVDLVFQIGGLLNTSRLCVCTKMMPSGRSCWTLACHGNLLFSVVSRLTGERKLSVLLRGSLLRRLEQQGCSGLHCQVAEARLTEVFALEIRCIRTRLRGSAFLLIFVCFVLKVFQSLTVSLLAPLAVTSHKHCSFPLCLSRIQGIR